jgi:hypothetical protein
MRREVTGLLALSVVLSACQATVKGVTPRQPSRVASAAPGASPSGAAKLPGLVAGSPAPLVPGEPSAAVNGLLHMEPSAVIAAGGGNVIAAGGGNVVAAGGGNLIKVGGQVIAAGGGNVIAPGGGNVIAPGGGNLIGQAGGNYRALAIEVPLGDMLPAQGMVVVPVSLRTGKPIGPAVLTDAQGRYQLQVPTSETGNVRVMAAVPGKTASDPVLDNPKLQMEGLMSVAGLGDKTLEIDDDNALVSRFFRRAFLGRIDELLQVEVKDPSMTSGNPLFDKVWSKLVDAVLEAKTSEMPRKARRELAERMANLLIADVDLRTTMVDRSGPDWPGEVDETAFDAYTDVMRQVRRACAAKLRADRQFFDSQPYVMLANERLKEDPAATPWELRRPRDLGEFITVEYFETSGRLSDLKEVFDSIDVKPKMVHRLRAAEKGLENSLALTIALNSKARDALHAMIADAKKN